MTDIFATLAARQIADEIAAAATIGARQSAQWQAEVSEPVAPSSSAIDNERKQRAVLVAQAEAVERDRALIAGLPHTMYAAVRYVLAAAADGPISSVDLDNGRGAISHRTLERARARMTRAGRLTTRQRGDGAWWVWLRDASSDRQPKHTGGLHK